MKTIFVLAVIFEFMSNSLAFKLGEHHHDHDQSHVEHHDHSNVEQDDHKETREGKANALSSDYSNNVVKKDNLGSTIDFTRWVDKYKFLFKPDEYFSTHRAVPVELDDGTFKNCVEKEEFREELK